MLVRGDKGRAVVDVQSALIELGYGLPRWGADGELGGETIAAFGRFMVDHVDKALATDTDGTLSDSELAYLFHIRDEVRGAALPPSTMVDRRPFADRNQDRGPRAWNEVSGICLHQTACDMGEREGRYDTMGAHAGILRSGKSILLHDFNRIVWHGNRWNAQTIGIEFNGLYMGIEGRPETTWDDPSTARHEVAQAITPAMVAGGMDFIRWAVAEVGRHGGRVRAIVAHRQASKARRNDPGSALWQAVALPLMDELGLTDGGFDFAVGGYPIPEAWDSKKAGIPY